MNVRRACATFAALLVVVSASSVPSYGQNKPAASAQPQDQQRKLSNDEKSAYIALSDVVDGVSAGKLPAPADVKLKFQHHFLKSSEFVYIPYILELSGEKFTSFPVTMYVRAVQKGAPAPEGKGVEASWPFADVYFLTEKNVVMTGDVAEVPRALQLSPGEYTLYVAMRERQPKDRKQQAENNRPCPGPDGAGHEQGPDDQQRHPGHGPRLRLPSSSRGSSSWSSRSRFPATRSCRRSASRSPSRAS